MHRLMRPRSCLLRDTTFPYFLVVVGFGDSSKEKWQQYLMFDRGQASALENESFAALALLANKCIEYLAFWEVGPHSPYQLDLPPCVAFWKPAHALIVIPFSLDYR
jgi:hypothetical protein